MGVKLAQKGFKGGMNYFNEDIDLNDDQYRLLINGRVRSGGIDPIYANSFVTGLPVGKRQLIMGFETLLLAVVAGLAYYRINGTTTWVNIPAVALDPLVDRVYGQAVPASSFNYTRALKSVDQVKGTQLNQAINNKSILNSISAIGLLLQDGINQPFIIFPDGTARVTSNYAGWGLAAREYVPIGTLMAWSAGLGKLYILAPNGVDIYQSVTGRPIDFVVNIADAAGNKGGNADTTSFNASNAQVTCLTPQDDGSLFIGGELQSYIATPIFEQTIFDEPIYNISTVQAGTVNQESIQALISDHGFVDFDGMRSVNAITEQGNEGRNGDFALNVAELFRGVTQNRMEVASIVFDNYCLYSVKTNIGFVVLVFDRLLYKWVSVDIMEGIPFKQFAISAEASSPTLYAITQDTLYKLYDATAERRGAQLHTGGFCKSVDLQNEYKTEKVRLVFFDSDAVYDASVTEVTDGNRGYTLKHNLNDRRAGVAYPVEYPIIWGANPRVDNLVFNFGQVSNTGFKQSYMITWFGPARLVRIQPELGEKSYNATIAQQAKVY